jgi:hypothetical protein
MVGLLGGREGGGEGGEKAGLEVAVLDLDLQVVLLKFRPILASLHLC